MPATPYPVRIGYSAAIFLGAFLLFAIEPLAAKRLLPALGGSSAVWITCLVFFQSFLLFGYLYAHALARRDRSRWPTFLHIALLALAAVLLAVTRPPDLTRAADHPVTAIFSALSISIGLPFLLLSSTSPLLQDWWARQQQSRIPWRLFALSNAGSLLALLLYPSLIEPRLTLGLQRTAWACGFVLYAVLCAVLAWSVRAAVALPQPDPASADAAPRSSTRARLLWFLLPAAAAMQLCAVTSHISQNIAAIPLLWILPLAVYLITFILAFEFPALYRRYIVIGMLVVLLASLSMMLSTPDVTFPIVLNISFFLAELFFACYFCHAETYALRPARSSEGTLFYLLVAAGGAVGTFFIGILCPLLFSANYDFALAFLATATLALAATWYAGWRQQLLWSAVTAGMLALVIALHIAYAHDTLLEERNFYGALRVKESHFPPQAQTVRALFNGTIQHGTQWFAPQFRRTPTTYYAADSGIGLALRFCCGDRPRNIGVIGLGAGTIAAYGRPGDRIRFYEINPAVLPIAQHLFTYLRDSQAQTSFAPGDARLSLAAEPPQHFDLLVIDAFTGDAIPVHLLTTQAMQIYRRHLAPGGILAFNVSNQYLDLAFEVAALAKVSGMQARLVSSQPNDTRGEFRASWVLVTDDADFFGLPAIVSTARVIRLQPNLRAWTDDYSSLLPILQWRLPNSE
ncbi:MAG TPA: fused MFS/spermidine synthase [Terracidiphilus sp.]|nr:fused MFS/spermidine synthase [Terracidiphilus sp.]